jgi:hypothetical protein
VRGDELLDLRSNNHGSLAQSGQVPAGELDLWALQLSRRSDFHEFLARLLDNHDGLRAIA